MSHDKKFVAFLRGINVGGHHKVPMADLKKRMSKLDCENVISILNSGNVIFESEKNEVTLEEVIAGDLEKFFGFPIPVIVRKSAVILELVKNNPFEKIKMTKDIRLYVSFLRENPSIKLKLPLDSKNRSFKILDVRDRIISSVLDLSMTTSLKGMDELEKLFGKDITTRNWNTILKIYDKLL